MILKGGGRKDWSLREKKNILYFIRHETSKGSVEFVVEETRRHKDIVKGGRRYLHEECDKTLVHKDMNGED